LIHNLNNFYYLSNRAAAALDLYVGEIPFLLDKKGDKTLAALNIVDNSTLNVKVRWIGGI